MSSSKKSNIEIMEGNISHLQASYNRTNTVAHFPLHVHDHSYEMMLFISGDTIYYIGDMAFHLEPGDVTLICPNDFHGVQVNTEQEYTRYPVHFSKELAEELSTPDTNLLTCFHTNQTRLCHLSESEQKDYIYYVDQLLRALKRDSFGWEIQARSALSLLLVLVNTASQLDSGERLSILPPIVQSTIRYVEEHLTEELNVQMIADSLGISRSRLMHLFKDTTNLSLWSYVTNKRIILAKDLLQMGYSITDACYESGFQDYSHFIKVFNKANQGLTPGQFAKTHANKDDSLKNSPDSSRFLFLENYD